LTPDPRSRVARPVPSSRDGVTRAATTPAPVLQRTASCPSGLLNRVHKFDSCRGHYTVADLSRAPWADRLRGTWSRVSRAARRTPGRKDAFAALFTAQSPRQCRPLRELRRVRHPGTKSPFPRKRTSRMGQPTIRSNPHSYRAQAAADRQQPILTTSPVRPLMPFPDSRGTCRAGRARSRR
jgi:hypothetical protein